MVHWEELRPGGLRFAYADHLFKPGTDTFLLSSFPRLRPGLRVCDLCGGTGLLGLALLERQRDLFVAEIELVPEAAELARTCGEANSLGDRFSVVNGDVREAGRYFPAGSFDLAVCNPPYYVPGSGRAPSSASLRAARSESFCTLEELTAAAARLVRWGGSFCLVHKPERLTDVLSALRQSALEPKRLRFVCRRPELPPSLFLAEGRRGGKPGLRIEPPLVLETAEGRSTPELDRIYFRAPAREPSP